MPDCTLIRLYLDYVDMFVAYLTGETTEDNYDRFCDWFADQLVCEVAARPCDGAVCEAGAAGL